MIRLLLWIALVLLLATGVVAALSQLLKMDADSTITQIALVQVKYSDANIVDMVKKNRVGIEENAAQIEKIKQKLKLLHDKGIVFDANGTDMVKLDFTKISKGECAQQETFKAKLMCVIIDQEGAIRNKQGNHKPYLDTSTKCKHVRKTGRCMTLGFGACVDCGTLKRVGFDWDGKTAITEKQALWILSEYIDLNEPVIKKEINTIQGECYEELPEAVRVVFNSMFFTMGTGAIKDFSPTVKAVCSGDYEHAADRILNTKFCNDVRVQRCKRDSETMRTQTVLTKKGAI